LGSCTPCRRRRCGCSGRTHRSNGWAPADNGFGDDPVDEEPLDEPDDLGNIGEIVPPISDDQLLIVGVRGLQKYFESDMVTFVRDVESLEQLAESTQYANAKELSSGQRRMVYYFTMCTGYSAASDVHLFLFFPSCHRFSPGCQERRPSFLEDLEDCLLKR
jgi:hypothetical protein